MKTKCKLWQLYQPHPTIPYKYILVAVGRSAEAVMLKAKEKSLNVSY